MVHLCGVPYSPHFDITVYICAVPYSPHLKNMVGDQFDARHENEKNGENKDKQNNRWFRE